MNKKMFYNIINILISNMIALFISILSAFVTPFVLGHEQFGYYKIFTLYMTYLPLLHMGFIDGILALNAGKKLVDIPLKKFRTYTKFFFIFEFIISIIMFLCTFIVNKNFYYREIFIYLSFYSFSFNLVTYFQFFSRAVMKFKQFAMITRIQSYINFVYLVIALLIYKFSTITLDVSYYLFSMTFTQFIILFYYIYLYRFLVFGSKNSIKEEANNIFSYFKVGFIIMFSYQIIMLMVNADNQFISMFFKVSQYAVYAFAYSLAGILLTIFTSVSSVLLPYMNKAGKRSVLQNHSYNLSMIIILIFLLMLSYYPILIISKEFLKGYVQSIKYLRIVFPGVAITCIIETYIFNNFIFLKKMKSFCFISIINLIIDYLVYYVVYIIFDSSFVVALSSVLLLIMWYFSLELYMHFSTNVNIKRNFIYVLLMSFLFVFINHIFNFWVGMTLYLISYISLTLFMYSKMLRKMVVSVLRNN